MRMRAMVWVALYAAFTFAFGAAFAQEEPAAAQNKKESKPAAMMAASAETAPDPTAIEDRKAAKRAARGAKAGRQQGTSSSQPASGPTAGEEPSSRQMMDKGNWVDPVKTAPYGTQYKTCCSKTINGEYSYLIYLPPDYETARDKRHPVIYWLHGGAGNQRTGDYFIKSYSEAMKAGKAPEAILILVNGVGGSFFCDSKDGKKPVETAIINDLIPHVDATYRTYGTREMRAIEGFSMGGFGALHLAMKFPETFCSVTALAHAPIRPDSGWPKVDNVYKNGPLQGDVDYFNLNDPFQLVDRNVETIKNGMTMRFIVGTSDNPNTQARTKEFYEKTRKLGITSTLTIVPGVGHAYVNLYDVIGNSFEYYTRIFAPKP